MSKGLEKALKELIDATYLPWAEQMERVYGDTGL